MLTPQLFRQPLCWPQSTPLGGSGWVLECAEGRAQMIDSGVETIAAPAGNGERESRATDTSVTVLAKEDSLTGRLQIRSGGSVLGTFNGRIECEGDLMIGPEAHAEG